MKIGDVFKGQKVGFGVEASGGKWRHRIGFIEEANFNNNTVTLTTLEGVRCAYVPVGALAEIIEERK